MGKIIVAHRMCWNQCGMYAESRILYAVPFDDLFVSYHRGFCLTGTQSLNTDVLYLLCIVTLGTSVLAILDVGAYTCVGFVTGYADSRKAYLGSGNGGTIGVIFIFSRLSSTNGPCSS